MPSHDTSRPNILFVLSDDQGAWALGCAGNSELHTPNLDRLAARGIRFENFFCASPVCSPARASILTGRIPSQHGVHDWLRGGNMPGDPGSPGPIEYLRGMAGYTDVLAGNGWVCGLSGKWHLGDSAKPQKGYTYWEVHAQGGSNYYGAPMIKDGEQYSEPRYVTEVITENALTFLDEQADASQPFYLGVHYTAPHSPWTPDQHPAETYNEYHENCPFESTPYLPMHPWQIGSAPTGFDDVSRRRELSGYYAAITEMDKGIGQILDRLDTMGITENTLIIFTSDNGMNMGHHGLYGKGNATFPQNMYDTSVKVPMIMSRPGSMPEGVVNPDMLSHYDIFPTLLEYLGLHNPEAGALPGTSFAAVLKGEEYAGRDEVVVFDEYGPVRMIRTEDWKYVRRYPYGPNELYHLAEDPDETVNLIDEEAAAEQAVELKGRLDAWFVKWAAPSLDGSREPVTGVGQQNLAGPAGKGAPAFNQTYRLLADE